MRAVHALLAATLLATGTGTATAAAAGSGPRLSPAIYPAPIAAPHKGALAECPNPRGIVPFTPAAVNVATKETKDFGRANLQARRLASDRSFWSTLRGSKSGAHPIGFGEPYAALPATGATGPGFSIIRHSCGAHLVRDTETVVLVPLQANGRQQSCVACRVHFYYLDRRGHALLYYLY